MQYYPFDIQVCKNTIRPDPNTAHFIKIASNEIIYEGPTDLMKYDISFRLLDNKRVSSDITFKILSDVIESPYFYFRMINLSLTLK